MRIKLPMRLVDRLLSGFSGDQRVTQHASVSRAEARESSYGSYLLVTVGFPLREMKVIFWTGLLKYWGAQKNTAISILKATSAHVVPG